MRTAWLIYTSWLIDILSFFLFGNEQSLVLCETDVYGKGAFGKYLAGSKQAARAFLQIGLISAAICDLLQDRNDLPWTEMDDRLISYRGEGCCGWTALNQLELLRGARNRNRTGTPLRARDFKSRVSTSFTIRATARILAQRRRCQDHPGNICRARRLV